MLVLKQIKKYYEEGTYKQMALNGIDLSFSPGETVAILGPSGCGKTTLLNIIGGLDRYTSGDLYISGKSTKDFKDSDWDSYRNNSIGFVFQSYNLINHISVLDNVEMALTLSGASASEKKQKAQEMLEKVGLINHANKRPNQLSGGERQRVAIARALANNPDIILLDEPTGALDSKTSVQILNLVQEVAQDKLIIMVTHNPTIAQKYSNRIIELKDGMVVSDSVPEKSKQTATSYQPKKTAMHYFTALKLSFNNLRTKLVRSLITAFAASIGIIGVALVLSISNGFGNQVNRLQRESLSGMPITISPFAFNFDRTNFGQFQRPKEHEGDFIVAYDPSQSIIERHENIITEDYIQYINNMDNSLYESISYEYDTGMFNLLYSNGVRLTPRTINMMPLSSTYDYILSQFKLLDGHMPQNAMQVVLVTDNYKRISQNILTALGVVIEDEIAYDAIIGKTILVAHNDDYYVQVGDLFSANSDMTQAVANSMVLEIVGILQPDTEVAPMLMGEGIAYDYRLANTIFETSLASQIVVSQLASDKNVLTGLPFTTARDKENALKRIGGSQIPSTIQIYANDFETKEALKTYLSAYNDQFDDDEQKIVYTDLAAEFTNIMSTLIDGISVVLIAFAGISLLVSSIMIGIITYVSVLERTKEIGILRSLGARKKDIARVFNAETMIIGFAAGFVGVVLTYLINIPLDRILANAAGGMNNIADLSFIHALLLVIVSIILTLISGLIPARIAAKKDPVNALRVES